VHGYALSFRHGSRIRHYKLGFSSGGGYVALPPPFTPPPPTPLPTNQNIQVSWPWDIYLAHLPKVSAIRGHVLTTASPPLPICCHRYMIVGNAEEFGSPLDLVTYFQTHPINEGDDDILSEPVQVC
jgi:hypothetical protein